MTGATVLNRFELRDRLGAGGHGVVYLAWDRRLEREVAVKVIETVSASGPRIQREAQAAARLNHPGIVALFEFVHHEYGPEGGRAYLVSELVEGRTLRELIDRDCLSDREIAEIGADLCAALDHAHDRGVVHRDIKPGNLIVPDSGHGAKLMDFGIARLLEADDLTATGDVLGTLAYMSPEQGKGQAVGPPTDLYSLALTLYEAWTGENPRRCSTPAETLRVLDLPPPELSRRRPDLPPELADMIDVCLDPEPQFRPPVEDLGRALERSLPALNRVAPQVQPLEPRSGPGLPFAPATVLPGLAIGAFYSAIIGTLGGADPGSIALSFLLVSLVSLLNPRLGFLLGGIGAMVWLVAVANLPGAALALGLAVVPAGLALRGDARILALIGVGPLLGLAGIAPFVALLAGLAEEWRDRMVVAGSTLGLTALVAAIAGRNLLPGVIPEARSGWAHSASDAVTGLIIPVLGAPAFYLALPAWILLATLAGLAVHRYRPASEHREEEDPRFAAVGSVGTATGTRPFEHELLS